MSNPRYAARTEVSSDKTRAEIERMLRRYGATAFASGWDYQAATLLFEIGSRRVRFRLPMPNPTAEEFTKTPTGKDRTLPAAEQAFEQAVRQRWRALALIIKAKLEAVTAGVTTVEDEFLAHTVLPDGRTVAEHTGPAIAAAYGSGKMPALLPGLG